MSTRKWFRVKCKHQPTEMVISAVDTEQAAINRFQAKHFPDSDWYPAYAVKQGSWKICNSITCVDVRVTEITQESTSR